MPTHGTRRKAEKKNCKLQVVARLPRLRLGKLCNVVGIPAPDGSYADSMSRLFVQRTWVRMRYERLERSAFSIWAAWEWLIRMGSGRATGNPWIIQSSPQHLAQCATPPDTTRQQKHSE